MGKLDDRLAALATMSPAQLRGEWLQMFRAPAPPVGHKLLALRIAWRLQEKALGGLPTVAAREIDAMARTLGRTGEVKVKAAVALKPGTRLVREWGGATHQVLLLDQGYLYQDQHYRSLSVIARRITGTNWSGPRFFGLAGKNGATA